MTAQKSRIDWAAAHEAVARGAESLKIDPSLESEVAKDILHRRAQALSRRAAQRATVTGERKLVVTVAHSQYALAVSAIAGVAPLGRYAPIPGSPSAHLGVTALRGDLWAVFDAARIVGESDAGPDELRHIVLLRGGKRRTALAVGELVGVRLFAASMIRSMTAEADGDGNVVRGWTPGPVFHMDSAAVAAHAAVKGEGR